MDDTPPVGGAAFRVLPPPLTWQTSFRAAFSPTLAAADGSGVGAVCVAFSARLRVGVCVCVRVCERTAPDTKRARQLGSKAHSENSLLSSELPIIIPPGTHALKRAVVAAWGGLVRFLALKAIAAIKIRPTNPKPSHPLTTTPHLLPLSSSWSRVNQAV